MVYSWLILAILAGLTSNLFHLANRIILKRDEDIEMNSWFFEVSKLLIFLIAAFFDFHLIMNWKVLLIIIVVGIEEIINIYLFMKMHKFTHLSISTIISRSRLIWVPIIALIFLHEKLLVKEYMGIFILFAGITIASAPHKIFLDKGIQTFYLFSLGSSLQTVLLKGVTSYLSPSVTMIVVSFPAAIYYSIKIKNLREKMGEFLKQNLHLKVISIIASSLSSFFLLVALKYGTASKVNAIYQSMLIFSIIAGVIWLKETKDMGRKIIGGTITLVGVLLLS